MQALGEKRNYFYRLCNFHCIFGFRISFQVFGDLQELKAVEVLVETGVGEFPQFSGTFCGICAFGLPSEQQARTVCLPLPALDSSTFGAMISLPNTAHSGLFLLTFDLKFVWQLWVFFTFLDICEKCSKTPVG